MMFFKINVSTTFDNGVSNFSYVSIKKNKEITLPLTSEPSIKRLLSTSRTIQLTYNRLEIHYNVAI